MNLQILRNTVYPRLPDLVHILPETTKYPPLSESVLEPLNPKNREHGSEIRTVVKNAIGHPPVNLPTITVDQYIVGNELDVTAKFIAHVPETVGATFQTNPPTLRFGDFPDAVVSRMKSAGRHVAGVIELKTPWTADLENTQSALSLHDLGQLVRYMEDEGVKYGMLSTYRQACLV